MGKVNLLDCTLRDGGYVNEWNFEHSITVCMFNRLVDTNVEMIEVGLLDDREEFNINRTIQPTTKCYDEIFKYCNKKNSLVFAMIDYGTCKIENIAECNETFLDGIRVIFKKTNAKKAIEFGKQLIEKGYKVCFQLVSITSYEDRDILDFVDEVNKIDTFCVSIVDTYGLLHNDDLLHYYQLLDYNLKQSIILGYHAHNNFQLAYSNCIDVIKNNTSREIVIDGTVYGMGKSAGNAPLELLAMFLNKTCKKNYDINQILEIIDTNILKIYNKKYWGYNLLYYLSASNDCHPNYVNYLLSKKTLSVKSINDVLKNIPGKNKLDYENKIIKDLYEEYQKNIGCKETDLSNLFDNIKDRNILVLGPGKSMIENETDIKNYIKENNPIIFSVNFIPEKIKFNYLFISNSKRYNIMFNNYDILNNTAKVIATSNITSISKPFDYILNYEKLLDNEEIICDNSLIMLLNAFVLLNISSVTLAGLDGFSPVGISSYYNEYLELSTDYDRLEVINIKIKERLLEMREKIDISFLTQSLYNN
ncbi:aldolase catalytic domain-containing protein [Clostridium sp. ZBS15]|uniref:aldolase catalytic domain-containing protein n=1 Tax=Clostridium sp. ZBS15 TaxID=2949969 RepID=UPI00207A3334|nr:aldolase catalytic domain-containing protein [Clostridium sp. ZBS15]